MKIAIFSNDKQKSRMFRRKLMRELRRLDIVVTNQDPDIVITVGGDGTLLSAFHRYAHQIDHIRFIGVHTGHLGFYTDWRDYELPELVEALANDSGQSVSYPLLDVVIQYFDQTKEHYIALNESTIRRVNKTMKTDVYIRSELFESFRGDGLCISTPTGSTAYSKSLGGAVLHPRLEALQMAEIASINNRLFRTLSSPIVIAPDEDITLRPDAQEDYILTIDSFTHRERPISQVTFRVAKERIHFARYRHMHFWDRVEDAFIGSKQAHGKRGPQA
ncbi:NAD kinase [Schleiferilactobacillus harbinensis]|uniref:NAD kinase n=2 Tax=Schleiferilactobacillus harbinensis TaxID=304207 RepID=A0A510TUQ9_9LACO|nr:NAD kinase [Schleiferilactobacillus harbinensis]HAY53366.1 NAD kinase [Lactobacillus sp.]MBO3090715.1 NAD kinase [Schleiferilactobacillus harbinensis]MCI1687634.1 NAD kinase [Schleiferilactobacillus harbinensis]MCI1782518.1 NAD kinase [Schleiferilactobacillus harbinensis]MCI1850612.1 NAD kinase [Schleiferilactobacillus harbinensis]